MAKLYRQMTALILAAFLAVVGATVSYSQTGNAGQDEVVGAVVRFSAGSTSIDLTIGEDNPTVRDFLSLLPLTMNLEEYASREKIGYFSRKLATEGSPGSDPEDGDVIYFVPWGNIGFYYNTAGIGFSNQTIHIGKYNASLQELEQLEGKPVRVERIQ
ncbi:cyclophilin-like fold protein [Mesorhizobium wenxiniae]|uniref:Cyclophilin-like domain-containing protein n=1 Tax=Mesorhizobium wenxiniae TaxID=2014805 RepID=A0A271KP13_9HYPH|nr:cyclophilin-like fold protein [Mesorhizobium wenxiniae]PAP96837.1 hypothetical protein CIT31_03820 [Mesorhizobium wenxiniae]